MPKLCVSMAGCSTWGHKKDTWCINTFPLRPLCAHCVRAVRNLPHSGYPNPTSLAPSRLQNVNPWGSAHSGAGHNTMARWVLWEVHFYVHVDPSVRGGVPQGCGVGLLLAYSKSPRGSNHFDMNEGQGGGGGGLVTTHQQFWGAILLHILNLSILRSSSHKLCGFGGRGAYCPVTIVSVKPQVRTHGLCVCFRAGVQDLGLTHGEGQVAVPYLGLDATILTSGVRR